LAVINVCSSWCIIPHMDFRCCELKPSRRHVQESQNIVSIRAHVEQDCLAPATYLNRTPKTPRESSVLIPDLLPIAQITLKTYLVYSMYTPSVAYIFSMIASYCLHTTALFSFLVGVSSPPVSEKLMGKIVNF